MHVGRPVQQKRWLLCPQLASRPARATKRTIFVSPAGQKQKKGDRFGHPLKIQNGRSSSGLSPGISSSVGAGACSKAGAAAGAA